MQTLYFSRKYGSIQQLWAVDVNGARKITNLGTNSSNVSNFYTIGNNLIFSQDDGVNGIELWKNDGTPFGTALLKDINTGSASSYPSSFAKVNGILYFSATDANSGTELWSTNGTGAGTKLVKDINPLSSSGSPLNLAGSGSTLYFAANDGYSGFELWKSDGSTGGTSLVKDIYVGSGNSFPSNFTKSGSITYFTASDGNYGTELWRTDGTSAGTFMVKDVYAGPGSSSPYELTDVNGTLFFLAAGASNTTELWKSDGTPSGTIRLASTGSGGFSSLTNFNGVLYFEGYGAASTSYGSRGVSIGLWRSDGTVNGTYRTENYVRYYSPSYEAGSFDIANITAIGGKLYFEARVGYGDQIFMVSAPGATPTAIYTLDPTATTVSGSKFFQANNEVYFTGFDGTYTNLYKIDPATSDVTTVALAIDPTVNIAVTSGTGLNASKIVDFNGDENSDLTWMNTSGEVDVWYMDGTTIRGGGAVFSAAPGFQVVGQGDTNGDGRSDIVLRNGTSGEIDVWHMDGRSIIGGGYISNPGPNWTVAGLTDVDGNKSSDIILRNSVTGEIDAWKLDGKGKIAAGSGYIGVPGPDWDVVGTGDFNTDSRGDLALRNRTTGEIDIWHLNGTTVLGTSGYVGNPGTDWIVEAAGDLNGDGQTDLVLRQKSTNELDVWLINGRNFIDGSGYIGYLPGNTWQVDQSGDFNADGKYDLVLHDTATNEVDLWFMDGAKIAGSGVVSKLDKSWVLS
ncbi:ELWxxDGT repeat protein [Methylobacterium nonmethylotrophicum]|uniref:Uncharacterized protein n=1 Tax=Methylobacterium nonmethylotrophicum TaxID=1141884 RepID=A0A4Z0NRQ1_9HYPH|nr:ELWxxDGT repeat protein [Methylobacterium nonmethylotrophicum]TGD99831.1 hypothetical protein EU555_11765 [Methylobacterium nonmethylotrophicum]